MWRNKGRETVSNYDRARTLAIVRQLAQGKHLTLPSGQVIGMGKDMSIGFVMIDSDSIEHIGGLLTLDLSELDQLLTEAQIGMPIPTMD